VTNIPYSLFGWNLKAGGVILPEERLPVGQTIIIGFQHVVAMFGATVLAPILMGFDPNVAVLFSGVGTLIFLFLPPFTHAGQGGENAP